MDRGRNLVHLLEEQISELIMGIVLPKSLSNWGCFNMRQKPDTK